MTLSPASKSAFTPISAAVHLAADRIMACAELAVAVFG
jgi:hypothetical protein